MRGAGVIVLIVLAWAFGFADGEAVARTHAPHVANSMSPGADPAQLQSAVVAWLRATVTSTQFIVGVAAGVVLAEALRFVLRWLGRAFGGAMWAVGFAVRHRLIFVAVAGLAYYVTATYIIA